MVLVTWLAKESYTIWTKSSMKLSYFLTNLGYFGLKSKELMSGVERSQFRRSKWPLSGLFSMVYGWWFSQGCLIHSLKSWDFSFLFFSSSRPVNTFNCQKCTFWVQTKSTSKIFNEKYYWILRIRRPEFSSKFWFFLRCFQFLSYLAFKLWNDKLSKIEFLGSEDLILVANFDSFWDVFTFCPTLSSNFKMSNCQKLTF